MGLLNAVADLTASSIGSEPSKSVLSDVKAFRFRTRKGADLDLSGSLVSWNDAIGIRLASHKYLKRGGAEQEPMGAEPGQFTMKLVFMGPSWAKSYRALVAAIRDEPRGTMDHPILGTMKVACGGIPEASVNPGEAIDTIELTVSFVEDNVDAVTAAAAFAAPRVTKAKVDALSLEFGDKLAALGMAIASAESFTAAAATFAAAARDALESDSPDTSLDKQLEGVGRATDVAIAEMRAASAARLAVAAASSSRADAEIADALSIAEQIYAQCLELAETVGASKPTIVAYVVPATMSVVTLCSLLYGTDALRRVDELLTLNRVAEPHAIPSGTVLRVPAPTNV